METTPVTMQRERNRRSERHRFIRQYIKHIEWKECLFGGICTLLWSLAGCFGIPSPFALSALIACLAVTGKPIHGGVAGIGAAMLLRWLWGLNTEVFQAVVYLITALFMPARFVKNRRAYGVLALCLGLCTLPFMIAGDRVALLERLGSLLLGVGCMPALIRCMELKNGKGKERTEDDLLCVAVMLMMLVCGGVRMGVSAVNFGLIMAGLMVVWPAYVRGPHAGAASGIAAGFTAIAGGQHVIYMMMLPFAGLLAGLFSGKKRLVCGGVFLFGCICLMYVTLNTVLLQAVLSMVTAALLFLLTPARYIQKSQRWFQQLQWNCPKENAYIRIRMQQWVRAIRHLSDALPKPVLPEEDKEELCENMAEKLCEKCNRLPLCWHEEYEKTKRAMLAAAECNDVDLQVINQHFSQCERIARLPEMIEEQAEKRRTDKRRTQMAAYEREMLETHLFALSQAAQLISLEGINSDEDEQEWKERVEEALEHMHFSGMVSYVKRIDGRLSMALQTDRAILYPAMGEKLCRTIGTYLGVRLTVTEQNATRVMLEEEAVFRMVYGAATAQAGESKAPNGERKENGDAYLVRPLPGGKVLVALADGMGHGASACLESRRTLQMIFACLEAGYAREQAMKVVNGAMLNATGGTLFSTVDMCVVDLWNGEAAMNKLGACGSVVIQGQKMHWISGEALPLGILENVLPAEKYARLAEEDRLILISDGIADAFMQEEDLMRALERHYDEGPQDMAESILQEAINRQGGWPGDDMTVLCVQLKSAWPERKKRAVNS